MNDRFIYENVSNLINVSKFSITDFKAIFKYPCSTSTQCDPISVYIQRGVYKFELWGSNGGDARGGNELEIRKDSGGKGAYVSGVISVIKRSNFFLYIGGKGEDQTSTVGGQGIKSFGGFNGGGDGGIDLHDKDNDPPESSAGGGGATDIRLVRGTSNASLASRIIIAAGGGGAESSTYLKSNGGDGGALEGLTTNNYTAGGTQNTGLFGKGDDGYSFDQSFSSGAGGSVGGGGAGYYGGYNIYSWNETWQKSIEHGGAGGSSYVSGCYGCKSVIYNQDNDAIETIESPYHPSFWIFKEIIMKNGNDSEKPTTTAGNGNGEIVISYIGPIPITYKNNLCNCIFIFIILFIYNPKLI